MWCIAHNIGGDMDKEKSVNDPVGVESVKPVIDSEAAARVLRDELHIDFDDLHEIGKSQISRSYSLSVGGQLCELQFTEQNMSQGCWNERFFKERFRQMEIPVRAVLQEGDYDGLHFVLAEKVNGRGLGQLPLNEFIAALPSVMDMLLRIASVDTSDTTGYGWLDSNGNGRFASWREHLCQVRDEEPGLFYDRWHVLFDTTFLSRKVFDEYYGKMEALIDSTPLRRELVHGGFGYGNVLLDNGQVTAVLDWQDARYGDHVLALMYTLSWLDRSKREAFLSAYKSALKRHGRSEDRIEDRIKCYEYYTGLDGMRFAAKTMDKRFYRGVLDQLTLVDSIY